MEGIEWVEWIEVVNNYRVNVRKHFVGLDLCCSAGVRRTDCLSGILYCFLFAREG